MLDNKQEAVLPFTPFHMGAAMLVKPVAQARFSVLAFGLAQVAMDVEPLVAMLAGWPVLHGWSHTVLGAVLIGIVVALVSPPVLRWLVAFFVAHAHAHHVGWIMDPAPPSRVAVWVGAMFGTLSHVALDGLMHADMRPWAPLSQARAWLGVMEHDTVYSWCAVGFAVGGIAWIVMRWRARKSA